jgi:hypothetical protein
VLAQRADLVILALAHKHVAIRAKIFVLSNAWAANIEKSHGVLLGALLSMRTRLCADGMGWSQTA